MQPSYIVDRSQMIVETIDQVLEENTSTLHKKIGLDSGLLGKACYHHARFLAESSPAQLVREREVIEAIFDKLNSGYVYHDMYREITDLAWYLSENSNRLAFNVAEDDHDDFADFDDLLYDQVKAAIKKKNFDPVNGAIKYGHYFVSRAANEKSCQQPIVDILDFLVTSSVSLEGKNGLYWVSRFDEERHFMYTGISHGIAGILLFCLKSKKVVDHPKLNFLINGCITALEERIDEDQVNVFPTILGKNYRKGEYPKNYVYGDFSTLFALLSGLKDRGDESKLNAQLSLFGVIHDKGYGHEYFDAGASLIYGDAGLILLFYKFKEVFDPKGVDEAIQFMRNRLLSRYEESAAFLGYAGHWNQHLPWTNLCFGEGLMGIRCVLAALSNPKIFRLFDQYYSLR